MDCLSLAQTIFADLAAGNLEAVLQRCADDVRFTAVRATGKVFDSDWALAMQFADGLLAHYRFYEDSAALEKAMEA